MKNIAILLIIFAIAFSATAQKHAGPKTAKELALSTDYLEVDLVKLAKEKKHSKADMDKLKAIQYRFYKHVRLVNGAYASTVTNGAAIHIAEADYAYYLTKLNSINAVAKAERAKGKKTQVNPIDDKYLNALLK
jgi:hypothetical protein